MGALKAALLYHRLALLGFVLAAASCVLAMVI
jgi:hypothetical protein